MTLPLSRMCAVVPAHNEEDLITACLSGLLRAATTAATSHPEVTIRIVVVADSCTDATASIASQTPGVEVFALTAATVGAARAEGIEYALAAFAQEPSSDPEARNVWIGNTDADSIVPENWFTEQILLANAGTDVMIRTVTPNFADLTPTQITAWTANRTPGVANGHVHGANLGVRASTYLNVGGFLPLVEHEDNDLANRLRAAGAVMMPSDRCDVATSGRQIGRTPGGYARYLAEDLL